MKAFLVFSGQTAEFRQARFFTRAEADCARETEGAASSWGQRGNEFVYNDRDSQSGT